MLEILDPKWHKMHEIQRICVFAFVVDVIFVLRKEKKMIGKLP